MYCESGVCYVSLVLVQYKPKCCALVHCHLCIDLGHVQSRFVLFGSEQQLVTTAMDESHFTIE